MENNKKNTSFISQDLQDSLKRISDLQLEYARNIFSSNIMADHIQKTLESAIGSYEQAIKSCMPAMTVSLTTSLLKLSETINSAVNSYITESLQEALAVLAKSIIPFQKLEQQALNVIPELCSHLRSLDCFNTLEDLPEEDFVVIDEDAVKTYELPETVCIPIGNCRIKMPTSTFLSIISFIFNTIVSISLALAQSDSSTVDFQNRQLQIEEIQLQLQYSQNEFLQQLLHDIDVSSSSEAQTIKELKEIVEEQNTQLAQIQNTPRTIEESPDTSESVEDTAVPR